MGWLCSVHHGYHGEVQAHSLSHDDNVTEVQNDSQSIAKGAETWNWEVEKIISICNTVQEKKKAGIWNFDILDSKLKFYCKNILLEIAI